MVELAERWRPGAACRQFPLHIRAREAGVQSHGRTDDCSAARRWELPDPRPQL